MEGRLKAGVNFAFMMHNYKWGQAGKQGFLLQGSGGSGKTFDALIFILSFAKTFANRDKDILITRETYSACKATVLKDFIRILKSNNLYDERNHVQSHPQKYKFMGNTISFAGRDDSSAHGQRNALVYFNEIMLDPDSRAFIQLNSRCSDLFIADYNPIYTQHWVYEIVKPRADTKFFKSTFLMNKHLPQGEKEEKLGFEPTHPKDRHLPFAKRRPHPTNIQNGTADERLWRVYGEGEAMAAEGVIFNNVNWIKEFPQGYSYINTIDFGFTVDPTVITRYAEDEKNIYIEPLSYAPMETPEEIDSYATEMGISKHVDTVADSSDKHVSETKGAIEMVKGLKALGWNIEKVKKTKSVMFWLNSMKKKKINIVENAFKKQATQEAENYRMKTVNGIAINVPVDKFNHLWDSSRYGHMRINSPRRKAFW